MTGRLQGQLHHSALGAAALDRQAGPDPRRALPHDLQAETIGAGAALGDAASVVGHAQEGTAVSDSVGHPQGARLGMAAGIGHRLLRDAQDLRRDSRRQPRGVLVQHQVHREAGLGAHGAHMRGEGLADARADLGA